MELLWRMTRFDRQSHRLPISQLLLQKGVIGYINEISIKYMLACVDVCIYRSLTMYGTEGTLSICIGIVFAHAGGKFLQQPIHSSQGCIGRKVNPQSQTPPPAQLSHIH